MIDITALKSLGRETKALVIIVEFQARRMPMFQMRELLDLLASNEEDKIQIAEMVERNLIGRGYPAEQVKAFLADMRINSLGNAPADLENTRKLRPAFTQNFEVPSAPSPSGPPQKPLAGMVSDGTSFIPRKPSSPNLPAVPGKPMAGTVSDGTSFIPRPSGTMPATPGAAGSGQRRATLVFESGGPPAAATPLRGTPAVFPPGAPTPPRGSAAVFPQLATPMVPPPAAAAVPPPATGRSADGRPMIVLAEDDKRARMVFRLRLEEAGFAVIECPTGTEAWSCIQAGGVVAAVLDMKMPGMHGLEVLKNMAQKQINIPVVVCTAYDQLEDEFVIQTYPKLRYLVKPIAPEAMINALRELLAPKPD